jgi:ribonuclease P protein component
VRRNLSGYTFYMSKRDAGPARLGMMVTRRHAAASTDRNRIKRCIREAFRLEQGRLGSLDLVVRPPLGASAAATTVARMRGLLARLSP